MGDREDQLPWNKVFQLGIEHTTPEQLLEYQERQAQPMSEVDRAFISNALKACSVDDVGSMKGLLEGIATRKWQGGDLADNLEELQYLCEDIDHANNLVGPFSGIEILLPLLDDVEPRVRAATAWVLASALQNNVKAQRIAMERGLLDHVVEKLWTEKEGSVRQKHLFAISALVRSETPEPMRRFIEIGGLQKLVKLMAIDSSIGVNKKASFLLRWVLEDCCRERQFRCLDDCREEVAACVVSAVESESSDISENGVKMMLALNSDPQSKEIFSQTGSEALANFIKRTEDDGCKTEAKALVDTLHQ